ncbi:MAG: hypothetical protein LAP40_25805 [Acidobacteriia bacterium]|nr:hypothetical protein [Terriglobia bacterium]
MKIFKTVGVCALATVALQVPQAHAAVSGAIFTTIVDGTIVNANTQYTSKCAVYLDGGPGAHAPAGAAGLPDGDYYFQVTDPNGKTLLSTDPVSNRRFQVSGGVITAYTGTGGSVHPTGVDVPHASSGAITVSLATTSCPTDFLDTPNGGGVYKVWVTPVTSFVGDPTLVDNSCGGGCYHGFIPSATKTDNFKVQPNLATFCLSVAKQLVDTSTTPPTLTPGFGWPITLTDPTGTSNNFFTNATDGTVSICGQTAGNYTVAEGLLPGYAVYGLIVNGVSLPPQTIYSFSWAAGQTAPTVVFQNQLQLF